MTRVLSAGVPQFQLTAARRRLDAQRLTEHVRDDVSTHSRPKAAGAGY